MSGLTTTGSTVISGLDALPRGLLMWRSLLQWLGGVGIIGMVLLVLPSLQSGWPDPVSTWRVPTSPIRCCRASTSSPAGWWRPTSSLTLLCTIAYTALGMSFFDAINHAMTTLATGGYSTHDASMGFFDDNRLLLVIHHLHDRSPRCPSSSTFGPSCRVVSSFGSDPQILVFHPHLRGTELSPSQSPAGSINDTPFGEALISSSFNLVSVITTTGYRVGRLHALVERGDRHFLPRQLSLAAVPARRPAGSRRTVSSSFICSYRSSFRRLVRPHSIVRLKYGNDEISEQTIQHRDDLLLPVFRHAVDGAPSF